MSVGPRRKFSLTTLKPVSSVVGFVKRIASLKKDCPSTIWYRGHSISTYQLMPHVGRNLEYNGNKLKLSRSQERDLLHRFRRRSYPHVGRIMNDWDAMILARHHSLPTRILDWTRIPLVALYFAAVSKQSSDGDVWAIARNEDDQFDLDVLKLASDTRPKRSPLELYGQPATEGPKAVRTSDAIKILHPFYNSPRIVSQDGVFTLHSRPDHPLEVYANRLFMSDRLDISALYRIPILKGGKEAIVKELDFFGINRRIVFPDLDGIAGHLWEVETLWRGKTTKPALAPTSSTP